MFKLLTELNVFINPWVNSTIPCFLSPAKAGILHHFLIQRIIDMLSESWPRRLRALYRLTITKLSPQLGLIFRAFFCLGVGMAVLLATDNGRFDTRFNIRGPQLVNSPIVLVNI